MSQSASRSDCEGWRQAELIPGLRGQSGGWSMQCGRSPAEGSTSRRSAFGSARPSAVARTPPGGVSVQPSVGAGVTYLDAVARVERTRCTRCSLGRKGLAQTSGALRLAAIDAVVTMLSAFVGVGRRSGRAVAVAASAGESVSCGTNGRWPQTGEWVLSGRETRRSITLGSLTRLSHDDLTELSKGHGTRSGPHARALGHRRGPTGLRRASPVGRAAKLARAGWPLARR